MTSEFLKCNKVCERLVSQMKAWSKEAAMLHNRLPQEDRDSNLTPDDLMQIENLEVLAAPWNVKMVSTALQTSSDKNTLNTYAFNNS